MLLARGRARARVLRQAGNRRGCPAVGLSRSGGRSRGIDLRLPCIREIAVILADVRDDQQLDEVERRAGGETQVAERLLPCARLCSPGATKQSGRCATRTRLTDI